MLILAAVPSTSVALVVTRSASLGINNGLAVSAGIVLADLLFIALAILGLSAIAETFGSLFMLVKILGGIYLIGYGISLLKPKTTEKNVEIQYKRGLVTSFLVGFLLTLGDIKAIVFYASLLPLFIDLTIIKTPDILAIIFITLLSVGGVKVAYALASQKVANYSKNTAWEKLSRKTAGTLMVGAGSYLIVKA